MSEVMQHLSDHLDESRIREIASHLGADPQQVEQAISVAVPTLIGAMGSSVESEGGAHAMATQLNAFGGGSLTDVLGDLLSKDGGGQRGSSYGCPSSPDLSDLSSITASLPKPSGSAQSRLDDVLDGVRSHTPASTTSSSATASAGLGGSILGGLLGSKQKKVEDAIGKSSGLDLAKVGPLLAILAPMILSAVRSRAQASSNSKGNIDPSDLSNVFRKENQSLGHSAGGSLLGRLLDQDGDGDFDLSDMLKLGARFLFKR